MSDKLTATEAALLIGFGQGLQKNIRLTVVLNPVLGARILAQMTGEMVAEMNRHGEAAKKRLRDGEPDAEFHNELGQAFNMLTEAVIRGIGEKEFIALLPPEARNPQMPALLRKVGATRLADVVQQAQAPVPPDRCPAPPKARLRFAPQP